MFTGSARAWLRHWSHHKGVQGIKIGVLSELRAIGNGMGILCVEGFTSRKELSSCDEQGFQDVEAGPMPFHARSAGLLLTQRRCAAKCLGSDWLLVPTFDSSNLCNCSSFYRFRWVNIYQTTWKCLQSHASWVPTCPNIPNPHSCLHALRRCRFMLIQKWIQKTIAEQNK